MLAPSASKRPDFPFSAKKAVCGAAVVRTPVPRSENVGHGLGCSAKWAYSGYLLYLCQLDTIFSFRRVRPRLTPLWLGRQHDESVMLEAGLDTQQKWAERQGSLHGVRPDFGFSAKKAACGASVAWVPMRHGSVYAGHWLRQPAKRVDVEGLLHWRRPDTILSYRRIRPCMEPLSITHLCDGSIFAGDGLVCTQKSGRMSNACCTRFAVFIE